MSMLSNWSAASVALTDSRMGMAMSLGTTADGGALLEISSLDVLVRMYGRPEELRLYPESHLLRVLIAASFCSGVDNMEREREDNRLS